MASDDDRASRPPGFSPWSRPVGHRSSVGRQRPARSRGRRGRVGSALSAIEFSGLEDGANSMRTNASGIGTRLAARVGPRWTVLDTYRANSGPGQSLQPVLIGLGGAPAVDFVAIDWSDAVFQTEMALAPEGVHTIVETQRQMSSCPVLFAWDGERFAFVTDFLGVGGMGYAVGPGEYAEPRPWENLLLPQGSIQPARRAGFCSSSPNPWRRRPTSTPSDWWPMTCRPVGP